MARGGMQALVARIHLDVHDVPAFEMNITDLPLLSSGVAAKDKAALCVPTKTITFLPITLSSRWKQKKCSNYSTINTPNFSKTHHDKTKDGWLCGTTV
jgi:hypothetical protein